MAIATVEFVLAGCDPVEVLMDQLTLTAVGNLFGVGKKRHICTTNALWIVTNLALFGEASMQVQRTKQRIYK